MNDTTSAPTATTRTRQEKTKRVFLDKDGKASPRANLSSVSGQVTFVETGDTLSFDYDDLTPEIKRVAALWGIMTAVTNTVGRADMDAQEMIEAATDRLKTIVDDGKWSTDRQSGPRTTDIIEAARRWHDERGKPFTPEMEAAMAAKLADEEGSAEYRANLMKHVAVHFAAIKSERAAERLRKARERSAGAADEPDSLI